jgi:hypothetical protein
VTPSLQAFLEDPLPGLVVFAMAFLAGHISGRVTDEVASIDVGTPVAQLEPWT